MAEQAAKPPSLSSLQASLVKKPATGKAPVAKSPVAKTPVAKTPVAKTPVAKTPVAKTPVAKAPAKSPAPAAKTPTAAKAPAAAPADAAGLKRTATGEAEGAPPAKKAAVPKPAVAKTPPAAAPAAAAKPPAAEAAAAAPARGSAPAPPPAARPPAAKPPAAAKAPAAGAPAASEAAAAASKPEDKALAAAITGLVGALEATNTPAALQQPAAVALADAMGAKLQIDHINQFLRALKKKVIERAQGDGIRVQPTSQLQKAKAAATASKPAPPAQATAPGASVVAKKASATAPGASVVVKKAAAPAVGPFTKRPAAAPPAAAPPAAAPAKAAAAPAKVAAAPPAKAAPAPAAEDPPPEPAASPQPSPPPAEVEDPLYVLIGGLVDDPVHSDGAIKEERLLAVLKALWGGVAKRPKDWCSTWQKMEIPAELQCEALQRFFNMAFSSQADDQEKAPSVVSELVKAHRLKLRSVEEVLVTFGHNLDGLLAMNEEAWQVYSYYLMHVSPKPAAAGWGWSRVGWSWASWWQYVEKCVSSLEASRQFDVIALLLKLIQDREGTPLGEVQAWQEGDKLGKAIAKLGEIGDMADGEVVEKLTEAGVTVEG